MSYVSGILQPGERVLAHGRLHWIIYKDAGIALILAAILLWIAIDVQRTSKDVAGMIDVGALFLFVTGVCFAIGAWFKQWITEMVVTNRRVIYKRGFIRRHTAEMNMDKIESVTVTQSILGRMLNYGTIHVRGTGEGIEHLHKIRAPIALRNCITAQ